MQISAEHEAQDAAETEMRIAEAKQQALEAEQRTVANEAIGAETWDATRTQDSSRQNVSRAFDEFSLGGQHDRGRGLRESRGLRAARAQAKLHGSLVPHPPPQPLTLSPRDEGGA